MTCDVTVLGELSADSIRALRDAGHDVIFNWRGEMVRIVCFWPAQIHAADEREVLTPAKNRHPRKGQKDRQA